MAKLHCQEPFIITHLLSLYDLNNVEREVKHQFFILLKEVSETVPCVVHFPLKSWSSAPKFMHVLYFLEKPQPKRRI